MAPQSSAVSVLQPQGISPPATCRTLRCGNREGLKEVESVVRKQRRQPTGVGNSGHGPERRKQYIPSKMC